jgi:hypothetical protein
MWYPCALVVFLICFFDELCCFVWFYAAAMLLVVQYKILVDSVSYSCGGPGVHVTTAPP